MDSPRKNNDCYFYYYSTCLKGDLCMFRHEPAALGCETVCTFWQQGKCLNQRCNFRHMELRKNRKIIPCYWENQPGGCRKAHCPFQHKIPREPIGQDLEKNKECENVGAAKVQERAGDWSRRTVMPEGAQFDECVGSSDNDSARVGPRRVSQGSETSYGSPPVDPLVVNFEEESDNESVPTSTPTKKPQKNVHVKTLEEIRLERIQAESAAFYSYKESDPASGVSDLRSRIAPRKPYSKSSQDFRVLTLEEIRKRKVTEANNTANGECLEPVEKRSRNCSLDSKDDLDTVKCMTSDSTNITINKVSDQSLTTVSAKCIGSLGDSKECSRKRSHSPITFNVSSKKPSVLVSEDHKNRSVIDKENDVIDEKVAEKELPLILKKFRKPLQRGMNNEVSAKESTTRVIRLRRKNMVENSGMVNTNLTGVSNEVSSKVPPVSSFVENENAEKTSASNPIIRPNVRTCEQNNGGSSLDTNKLQNTLSSKKIGIDPKEEIVEETLESKGAVGFQNSVNCDKIAKDKWSSSNQDDELFLDNNEYPVVLRADEDILQDIDELLRD